MAASCRFPGDDISIVRGSALAALQCKKDARSMCYVSNTLRRAGHEGLLHRAGFQGTTSQSCAALRWPRCRARTMQEACALLVIGST